MNKDIMKQLGFYDYIDQVENNNCPICKKKIDINKFKDELNKKEFQISGLCQSCQDDIFGEE